MDKTIYNPQYRRLIDRLRSARKQAGITQAEASLRLGATRSWVGKIETCELRLDVHGLARLARVYGVDAGRLVRQLQEELPEEDSSSLAIRRHPGRVAPHATSQPDFTAKDLRPFGLRSCHRDRGAAGVPPPGRHRRVRGSATLNTAGLPTGGVI